MGRSRIVKANLESNSEPKRARVGQNVAERASGSHNVSHSVSRTDRTDRIAMFLCTCNFWNLQNVPLGSNSNKCCVLSGVCICVTLMFLFGAENKLQLFVKCHGKRSRYILS